MPSVSAMQPTYDRTKCLILIALVVAIFAPIGWAAEGDSAAGPYTKVTFDQVNADLSKHQDQKVEIEVFYGRPFSQEECSLILVFGLLDINQFKEHIDGEICGCGCFTSINHWVNFLTEPKHQS